MFLRTYLNVSIMSLKLQEYHKHRYNTLMRSCGLDTKKTEHVLKKMKENGILPDATTFNTLMKSYDLDLAKCEEIMERMYRDGVIPDVLSYVAFDSLISHFLCGQKYILEHRYNTLMHACGSNTSKAEAVLSRMKQAGLRPNVVSYVVFEFSSPSTVLLYLGYTIDRHDTHLYYQKTTPTPKLECYEKL